MTTGLACSTASVSDASAGSAAVHVACARIAQHSTVVWGLVSREHPPIWVECMSAVHLYLAEAEVWHNPCWDTLVSTAALEDMPSKCMKRVSSRIDLLKTVQMKFACKFIIMECEMRKYGKCM